MKAWNQITHYGALDWARDHHDIVVVDRSGTIVADFRIQHTLEGWNEFRTRLAPFPDLAIAVETNQGPAVEQMVSAGLQIYPINPKSAKHYRDRKKPTGTKNDRLDAWAMADAMVEANYLLQCHVYSVALHRFLAWRLADYRYQDHFGGIFYLFLRGMPGAGASTDTGVFRDVPPQGRIQALSTLLGG